MISATTAMERPANESRMRRIYSGLLLPGEDHVRVTEILRLLADSGLREDDPRLSAVFKQLHGAQHDAMLNEQAFRDVARAGLLLLEAAVSGGLLIPEFSTFAKDVREVFREAELNREGRVADYIPQLGRVKPEQFGLAVCTIDGQRLTEGDAFEPFCVQSVSKPLNYCLALDELGESEVHKHMGCEPSGVSFNELALNANGRPHNPMINAGGIMSCALIKRNEPVADRFDYVTEMWTRLGGNIRPGFSNATYLSERATADRNFALGYSLREHRALPDNADLIECLEFYFQCCSLESTADTLSVIAATLANGGLCPLTGEQVLSPRTVQSCLSLMLSCGLYDYSGEWAFRIGLPAKSGVSGVVLTVVPNVLGICTWSPRLDAHGNSVRGIEFCKKLVEQFNFHIYDGLGVSTKNKIDPRRSSIADERQLLVDLCWAASEGDCDGIQRLVIRGADVNAGDYDGRTPLHLAASEGRADAVTALLRLGALQTSLDRWGNTAEDDARREGNAEVVELLVPSGEHAVPPARQ